jgi:PKD repeat protein
LPWAGSYNWTGTDTLVIDWLLIEPLGDEPAAKFSANSNMANIGDTVCFFDQSPTATSWSWGFPGGNPVTSTLQNPKVVYDSLGVYDVSLTAANASDSKTATEVGYITIDTFQSPVIPIPEIAGGNNGFENQFLNWTRLHDWGSGSTNIGIDTSHVFCGENAIYFGGSSSFEQLYADITDLTIGQSYTLYFYAATGEADLYIGSTSDVYNGTYFYLNATSGAGEYILHGATFTASASIMRIWFDLYPASPIYLDGFTFESDSTNHCPVVSQCSQADDVDPVISACPTDIVSCSPVTAFSPPTASDNCNVSSFTRILTEFISFTETTSTFEYVAIDDFTNTDTCRFTITKYPLPRADAGNDTTITAGIQVNLGGAPTGSGGYPIDYYLWFPSTGLNDSSLANPTASPIVTTNYIVYVIDTNGCAATDVVNVTVNPTLDIEDISKLQRSDFAVEIYSNFSNRVLNFRLTPNQTTRVLNGPVTLSLVDILGRRVYHIAKKNIGNYKYTIDADKLPSGHYFVKVTLGQNQIVEHVLILR